MTTHQQTVYPREKNENSEEHRIYLTEDIEKFKQANIE